MYRLPGGAVDKNPPANTGDTGSMYDLRKDFCLHEHAVTEPQLNTCLQGPNYSKAPTEEARKPAAREGAPGLCSRKAHT